MALVLPLIGFHPNPRRLQACLLALALACGPALAAPTSGGDTPSPAGTVQVQDGDMASVLAFRLKPRGATIEQMMLALQRLNPDAFIQGNVNLLRDGAVLRLPSAEEVFSLSPEQARDKVRGQHMAFLGALELPSAQASAPAAQPANPVPGASDPEPQALEREALLERLRQARAHLAELQQNIEELEKLTRDEAASAAPEASAAPTTPAMPAPSHTVPLSWIWLGVAAIVAVMVGIGASRRSAPAAAPAPDATPDAARQFQTRLASLDLNLDAPSSPGTTQGRTE